MASTLHHHRTRAAAALVAALMATALTSPGAHAAPPVNDTPSRAAPVAAVPTVFEVDTRAATYDTVRRSCVYARSVWYRYEPATTGRVRISTVGSSYDTVLAVYSGARSPQTRLSCNDDAAGLQSAVRPSLVAGRQYWIAVSSCCGSPSARGGDLVLRFSEDPAAASVEVSNLVATAGAVSGRLRVTADVTCATPSVAYLYVSASQRVDTHVARGGNSRSVLLCSTDPVSRTIRIDSETGWAFATGPAALDVYAEGDDGFSRVVLSFEQNVDVGDDPDGRRVAR
ncbi:hypothetical protein [Nocardioides sp. GXQ0305]|uniref:hypothetical protein n=1 Tax=Nocardioides sp. GXQ0305 TaxID=3423912 RepID=UPI003D7DA9EB